MNNLEIYNKVRNVPTEAQKKIMGGNINGFTDINPMWRIKTLTEQFGVCGYGWYTEILKQWTEAGADGRTGAFCNINLYIKVGEEWSKPISGTGGSMFTDLARGDKKSSDECFKMAYTDAISVACKALGIGADIYFEKDPTKYDGKQENNGAPVKPVHPTTPPQDSIKFVCADCGKTLTPHRNSDGKETGVREIAEKSHAAYGKTLCAACVMKRAKADASK